MSGVEFGVPVWNSARTKKEINKIERVQKIAMHIIYRKKLSYSAACKYYKIDKLIARREKLCVNFAEKAIKHEKFKNRFLKNGNNPNQKTKYVDTLANSKRLENSPIPYLTKLLNKSL